MEKNKILDGLRGSPAILRELIFSVPEGRRKERRIPGKWSAHEHACHMAKAQAMLNERARRFLTEEKPVFVPYFPGKTTDADELLRADLHQSLNTFEKLRVDFVNLLGQLKDADWQKRAEHPEYDNYTPYLMARHVLLHDFTHMYRIEELWLTRDLPHK
ncbi:MAG: DinB family protein [Nitrospinae bacterium]|nr:DinB family protein [Nitrospinota bacterium]